MTPLMRAVANGPAELCLMLADLGADLNLEDRVSDICSNCISVCCCVIVIIMLNLFFELVWKGGVGVGC